MWKSKTTTTTQLFETLNRQVLLYILGNCLILKKMRPEVPLIGGHRQFDSGCQPPFSLTVSELRRILSMASEELARKLQSRLSATQEVETRPEPEQSPVPPRPQEPEAAGGDSSSELSAKLTRRLDINEGNAAPRPTRVFNPYTEFKEFSRKQIKDMETMFKR